MMNEELPATAILLYAVSARQLTVLWLPPDGRAEEHQLGTVAEFLPRLERLHDDLHNAMAVARGRVPSLAEFVTDWGSRLLPPVVFSTRPEILVIVPHALLHDVPLHLANDPETGLPLCSQTGVTYCSSMTLFEQCRLRNPRRLGDPSGHNGGKGASLTGRVADVATGDNDRFLGLISGIKKYFTEANISAKPLHTSRIGIKPELRRQVDVLCLAVHGHADPANNQLSGILLPPSVAWLTLDRGIDIGQGMSVRYRDLPFTEVSSIRGLRHGAELLTRSELEVETTVGANLVVLLACSAGFGLVAEGDEPASIAEMLLRMGGVSVLAASWDVDTGFAQQFVQHFISAWLVSGHCKALAHRSAVRTLLAEGWGQRPDRLGAFTLRGDWL